MVAIEKKLRLLEIDTKPIPLNLFFTPCSEEEREELDTKDQFMVDSPIPSGTRRQRRLTTTSNKRYSASFLNHPINIHNRQHEDLPPTTQNTKLNGHKRSTSAGSELFSLPRNYSTPDFHVRLDSSDSKGSIRSTTSSKKKWFQLPRMTLIRQSSTPPTRDLDGLKAGLVEPPEPPPQLLFNLDWSSKNSPTPLLWDNDVSNHSFSTPTSPNINRRSSGYGFDIIVSNDLVTSLNEFDVKNDNSSNIPTDKMSLPRRLSLPDCENILTPSAINTNTKEELSPQNTPPLTPHETSVLNHKIKITTNSCNSKLFSSFQRPALRRKTSSDSYGVAPSASSSTSSTSSTSSSAVNTPCTSPSLSNGEFYKPLMFNVYAPNSCTVVLNFSKIKPRVNKLRRKSNLKAEQKALQAWQNQLLLALDKMKSTSSQPHIISPEKKARYLLTRKFILREFYTTEINYWNQLNYTKVMFADPLQLAFDKHSDMVRPTDLDWFANLSDLMKFSSTLILRLRNAHAERPTDICQDAEADPGCKTCPNDVKVGLVLRESAEQMVTFLNCALDYRANKKSLDNRKHDKGYALYNEKLALRKETRQFTLHDYLIIPIQRITRYGLLLADLEKHTESTHPDYEDIKIARCIVHSLAAAMNSVQKKS